MNLPRKIFHFGELSDSEPRVITWHADSGMVAIRIVVEENGPGKQAEKEYKGNHEKQVDKRVSKRFARRFSGPTTLGIAFHALDLHFVIEKLARPRIFSCAFWKKLLQILTNAGKGVFV